jgi:hypothetical protein
MAMQREPGSERMANSVHGVKHFQDAAHGGGMLAGQPGAAAVWRSLHRWRWPAALLAGIVLWLALVALAGAATPRGAPPATATRDHPFVINNSFLQNAVMPASLGSTRQAYCEEPRKLQTGFTPRP